MPEEYRPAIFPSAALLACAYVAYSGMGFARCGMWRDAEELATISDDLLPPEGARDFVGSVGGREAVGTAARAS